MFTSIDLQDHVSETDIVPHYKTCSDHGMPIIHLKGFGIQTRGPGVWKFNNASLEEAEFSYDINNNLPIWINEAKTDTNQSLGD